MAFYKSLTLPRRYSKTPFNYRQYSKSQGKTSKMETGNKLKNLKNRRLHPCTRGLRRILPNPRTTSKQFTVFAQYKEYSRNSVIVWVWNQDLLIFLYDKSEEIKRGRDQYLNGDSLKQIPLNTKRKKKNSILTISFSGKV